MARPAFFVNQHWLSHVVRWTGESKYDLSKNWIPSRAATEKKQSKDTNLRQVVATGRTSKNWPCLNFANPAFGQTVKPGGFSRTNCSHSGGLLPMASLIDLQPSPSTRHLESWELEPNRGVYASTVNRDSSLVLPMRAERLSSSYFF